MVSLRAVKQDEARQARLLRVETARRVGSALGVAGAQRYQEQKRRQAQFVDDNLRAQWVAEKEAEVAQMTRFVQMAEAQRGAGHAAAERHATALAARAAGEEAAWEAERRLCAMRAAVAVERKRLDEHVAAQRRAASAERRARVKSAERDRSMRVVNRSRSRDASAAAGGDPLAALHALQRAAGRDDETARPRHNAVVVHPTALDAVAPPPKSAAERAVEVATARRIDEAEKQRRVATRRVQAQRRATDHLQQRRHEEEVKAMELERATQLRQTMLEQSLKRNKTGFSDFQEEEVRKSVRANRASHVYFEKTFLKSDGWTVAELQRHSDVFCPTGTRDDSALLGLSPLPVCEEGSTRQQQQHAAALAAAADRLRRVNLASCPTPLVYRPILPAEQIARPPVEEDDEDAATAPPAAIPPAAAGGREPPLGVKAGEVPSFIFGLGGYAGGYTAGDGAPLASPDAHNCTLSDKSDDAAFAAGSDEEIEPRPALAMAAYA